MRAVVRSTFWSWTVGHEGYVPWPYLDIYGLLTTGVGNLLPTTASATALPWRRKDGSLASRDEIIADVAAVQASGCGVYRQWDTLPNGTKRIHCAWRGTGRACSAHQGHKVAERVAQLRLTEEAVRDLVLSKLDSNERIQAATFPFWESLPADAQLAVHSMAWAVGAHWPTKFRRLATALRERNYGLKKEDVGTCVGECTLREVDNPGVVGRNRDVRVMFANCTMIQRHDLDPEVLYFPRALNDELVVTLGLGSDVVPLSMEPFEVVTVMPDTAQQCGECGLVSCEGH